MKRSFAYLVRVMVILTVATLVFAGMSLGTSSSKYYLETIFNYESSLDTDSSLGLIDETGYKLNLNPNYANYWRGFDVIYTAPIVVTPGTAAQGRNSAPLTDAAQVVLYDCPAGWYAFKLQGAHGGNGSDRTESGYTGWGGKGGAGAVVSGWTYIEGGTIILRAGRVGNQWIYNNPTAGVEYGGGATKAPNNNGPGSGGGYSGIFCDTSGGMTVSQGTAIAIAGGGGGGGGAGNTGTGYHCQGNGGNGGSYNLADNGTGVQGAAPGVGQAPASGHNNGSTASKGQVGSGGGGGGAGGNRDCSSHDSTGGTGGTIYYNQATSAGVGIPYYGKGGGGGGGGGGAGENGGYGGGQNGGGTVGNGGATAGSALQGGAGGYSSGNNGIGSGSGGGGYAGGGGGGHGSKSGGGGGGGSSYLQPWVYPLTAMDGYPGLSAEWHGLFPTDPGTTASNSTTGHKNGFVWILYLGARSPDDPGTGANGYQGNNSSENYHFGAPNWG